ncbi:hypothetical protein TWF751_007044 [Orbilia oligospora]|nr:hypothetical protein TWF751_007044 [Orbilia oligospora]
MLKLRGLRGYVPIDCSYLFTATPSSIDTTLYRLTYAAIYKCRMRNIGPSPAKRLFYSIVPIGFHKSPQRVQARKTIKLGPGLGNQISIQEPLTCFLLYYFN